MRIDRHVSIILAVAIAGAIGLALAVGLLFRGMERAAYESGKAFDQYHQVKMLLADGKDLLDATKTLTTRSSEERFAIVGQAVERSMLDLARLRHASLVLEPGLVEEAIQTLAESRQLEANRSSDVRHPDELEQFHDDVGLYMKRLGQLERRAANAASKQAQTLAQRRRMYMLIIGVICIIYLAVVERVRHWTRQRLIEPLEGLASAAVQAMDGEETFPGLEQGSTEELKTLSRVMASLVDTHKAKVRERTVQIERQKERLERELRVRRRAEEQLRHSAFHDRLTGLCSRDLLADRLERCAERAQRHEDYDFAVFFLDIDWFKEINDSLGSFIGDQLLVAIGKRLQQCLRSNDSLARVESDTVARIGGDEFVVLLDGIKARSDANLVADRLEQALAAPFRLDDHEVSVTASIGIAFNEGEREKVDDLIRDADTAMYYAKATGKARHEVFNKKMHAAATERIRLCNDLRKAIENEELDVAYQPIISLKSGRLSGFEALARWEDPGRGDVSPVEFIAAAEETELIVQLGQRMLDQACRQLRVWHDQVCADRSLSVSVNVSKRQLAEPEFVRAVQQILRSNALKGADLKLEITESAVMENPDSIARVLQRLKDLQVEIHMDDFGTGYSSLSHLHRFPLDVLKIDRAFMSAMSRNNNCADVVHTVVAMAHTLNLQVTVEGVETQDQLAQLMALGCDYAQGHYFSEPLDAESAAKVIASEREWLQVAA